MRQLDQFGLAVTLPSAEAVDAWDATVKGFLSHAASTPDSLQRTLELAPGFAMGLAARGLFCLMLGRRELVEAARRAAGEARAAAARVGATAREQAYVTALDEWLAGRPSGSVRAMEEILRQHPEDGLAMKISHAIRFILGDPAGMRRSVERALPAYGPDNPAHGYALGCHAFALEETGEYARAELAGRMALSAAPDDAWALHAVAHVHEMRGDARAGLRWLQGREAAWAHCNNFRYHVWWHKALMHLSEGAADRALALYDTEIRRDRTDDYRDIANATSLLIRLELEGVNVGNRWEELAELSARRTADGCLIFADLHYLLALMGGRRPEAEAALLARIARDARTARADEMTARMAAPGMAAAEGLSAFGKGDYATAFERLCAARASLQLAGGSHAQRDVFERIAIDAGIRAGRLDGAQRLLDERRQGRGGARDAYALAREELIDRLRGSWQRAGRLPAE